MKLLFTRCRRLLLPGLLAAARLAPAQEPPTIVTRAGLLPAANARAASATAPVVVPFEQGIKVLPATSSSAGTPRTFPQPIAAGTAGGIRVFSAQYRGLRQATATVGPGSTNTVALAPTVPPGGSAAAGFRPGETVAVTVPATVKSTGGVAAVPYVYQFTVAAKAGALAFGDGRGPAVGTQPVALAVGDVNGDGDLDLLVANRIGPGGVYLNHCGTLAAPAANGELGLHGGAEKLVLGDMDGDGDLDVVAANPNYQEIGVRLNNGSGSFSAPASNANVSLQGDRTSYYTGRPTYLALGDLDGDGDLDLVVADDGYPELLQVLANNGSGSFALSGNPIRDPHTTTSAVGLGDVDSDGDLDLVVANGNAKTMQVLLNDGGGHFGFSPASPPIGVSGLPYGVVLADVDGDSDLDLVTANDVFYPNGQHNPVGTASVRLNNGRGAFSTPTTNAEVALGNAPHDLALGDVDGDGDLDLLAANLGSSTVSVRLNDGRGTFTGTQEVAVGRQASCLALADVDGDGDLDVLTADFGAGTVSVRLN